MTHDNVLSGTVRYREPVTLPPRAVVSIVLSECVEDVGAGDAIAESRVEPGDSAGPIIFAVAYDPKTIDEGNRYCLRAEVRDGDKLIFISDTSYEVLTRGAPRVADIVVVPT